MHANVRCLGGSSDVYPETNPDVNLVSTHIEHLFDLTRLASYPCILVPGLTDSFDQFSYMLCSRAKISSVLFPVINYFQNSSENSNFLQSSVPVMM